MNYVFGYDIKVCIFLKFIQYTIYEEKTQIIKNFSSDKINVTKNTLFFSPACNLQIPSSYMNCSDRNKKFWCYRWKIERVKRMRKSA